LIAAASWFPLSRKKFSGYLSKGNGRDGEARSVGKFELARADRSEREEIYELDLVREQQADGLQRLLPSIHVVSEEEVVGLWRLKEDERSVRRYDRENQDATERRTKPPYSNSLKRS